MLRTGLLFPLACTNFRFMKLEIETVCKSFTCLLGVVAVRRLCFPRKIPHCSAMGLQAEFPYFRFKCNPHFRRRFRYPNLTYYNCVNPLSYWIQVIELDNRVCRHRVAFHNASIFSFLMECSHGSAAGIVVLLM